MTSTQPKSDDHIKLTFDSSSIAQQYFNDMKYEKPNLLKECTQLQKQEIDHDSRISSDEKQRIFEEKDNELKSLRESTNVVLTNNTWTNYLPNDRLENDLSIHYKVTIDELTDENTHLKNEIFTLKAALESKELIETKYCEQIHRLQLRITELEDWNEDFQKNEPSTTVEIKNQESFSLQTNIDLLTSRNRQLENDLQRLQLQQRNNQLALERLDEYEETIGHLQEELNKSLLNKKKQQGGSVEDIHQLVSDERKRYDAMCNLLEETRLQLTNERKQSENKIIQIESNFEEKFEQEKIIFQNQLQNKQKQLETERNEREKLEKQLNDLQQSTHDEEEESRLKEIYVRDMLEKQIIELNEQVQFLESDKNELNYQIDELQQQLQSKETIIENFQTLTITPGAPPISNLSSTIRESSLSFQTSSDRLSELENQIFQKEEQFRQMNSIYNQFLSILPNEFSLSNDSNQSLEHRFINLFEQYSTYIGTFSIIQEEFDSLKQILIERQDELEKLRTHLELTTDKLTQLQEEQSLLQKNKPFDSDEDELEEILGYEQRAPSRQSLLSITPGEKQQLISQNELLSTLLAEKEQELITLQQDAKSHEELIKTLETLRFNLHKMENDKANKDIELSDIKHVLDEKLRENSSLKKEKMYFIEKLASFERERQEQQLIIQTSSKQSSPERVIQLTTLTTDLQQQMIEKPINREGSENLYSKNDSLVDNSNIEQTDSLSYYNQYTNILTLYNELLTKFNQLEIAYKSIESLVQQKNEAYLQCQNELNTYQNLLYHQKKKSDDIDFLRSKLNEKELKIEELISNEGQLLVKQSDFEIQLKFLEENNFKLKKNQQLFDQIQLDLKRITHERDLAIVDKKQIENELESNREKLLQYEEREKKLMYEVERLSPIEESLKYQLELLENSNREKTEIIHHLSNNMEQPQQEVLNNLEKVKYEQIQQSNMNLTDQLRDQIDCTKRLQNILDQYPKEREEYIKEHLLQYQDSLREQISISARLTNENNELNQRLEHYNDILSSVNHLKDEVNAKDLLIYKLQTEIGHKNKQIVEYSGNFHTTNDTRVEKQLVKNILLSYFHTPIDKQQEVIPILSALVGFTQEEYQKVLHAISNNYNNTTSTNWLTSWLNSNSSKPKTQPNVSFDQSNKSFAELLIQYVDQESLDNFSQPLSNSNTDQLHDDLNSQNLSSSTSDKSSHFSIDKQTDTNLSATLNVEPNLNMHKQSSLPNSSTLVDDILQV